MVGSHQSPAMDVASPCPSSAEGKGYIRLPRGGFVVPNTPIGSLQFGIPPETIKDTMKLPGNTVPTYYVVYGADAMFSRSLGISKAEFEFPAYYNYFVLGKRVNLITTLEYETRMRMVFQETLMGPSDVDPADDHCEEYMRNQRWCDVLKEAQYLDRDRPRLSIEKLLCFTLFDEHGKAVIQAEDGQSLEVEAVPMAGRHGIRNLSHASSGERIAEFVISSAGTVIARVPGQWEPTPDFRRDRAMKRVTKHAPREFMSSPRSVYRPMSLWDLPQDQVSRVTMHSVRRTTREFDHDIRHAPVNGYITDSPTTSAPATMEEPPALKCSCKTKPLTFSPALFGVTMLGSSHGFDPEGNTTGFVMWVNRRGLMVDPPPESFGVLQDMGVPASVISGIVLTHCHADHDAGTFQRFLGGQAVTIYTTKTIFESFLRKYAAVSELSVEVLRSLCNFRRVRMGETVNIHGGFFRFFYSLHVIPCVGFEVSFGGHSIAYSADTHTNPALVEQMYRDQVVSRARAEELKAFPSARHSLILHEAGVPPIHTPISVLEQLPDEVKCRLWLVHVADHTVPPNSGLMVAHEGETILVDACVAPDNAEAMEMLQLVQQSCVLGNSSKSCGDAVGILQAARRISYPKGAQIVQDGSEGSLCFIVVEGACQVVHPATQSGSLKCLPSCDGLWHGHEHYLAVGDLFGETSLVEDEPCCVSVYAATRVTVVQFTKEALLATFGPQALDGVQHLAHVRRLGSRFAIDKNSVFGAMNRQQKLELEQVLQPCWRAGTTLWTAASPASAGYLFCSAVAELQVSEDEEPCKVGEGAFVCEVDALLKGGLAETSFTVVTEGMMFSIDRPDLIRFLRQNPGVYVSLIGQFVAL
eukprot:jgi/Chlat1/3995/Chrsp26S04075